MASDAPQSGPVPMPGGALPPPVPACPPVLYPDSDGEPMADNTKQARWIVVLFDNLKALFRERADVFIAANHLWYAVEGEPGQRVGPDVMVVFGRPKGDRGSYRQWEEGGVPVTVVFEVLSPGNTEEEMRGKYLFYEEHGVEEYYIYDPDRNRLEAYQRRGSVFRREHRVEGLVSPRLGVRFAPSAGAEMVVYYPNGEPFVPFEDLAKQYEHEKRRYEQEKTRADEEKRRADEEKRRADAEKRRGDDAENRADDASRRADDATSRADDATSRADDASRRADALARIVELGRKARRGQATAEELAELERLEGA